MKVRIAESLLEHPYLQLTARSIHDLLRGRHGVNSGHQTLHNAEIVVDDLGQKSQAVGGARGVAVKEMKSEGRGDHE